MITNRLGAAFAFLTSLSPIGNTRGDEVVALPWADAKVEKLATLDNPWAMAFLPDGRLLITEKPGNLRIYADGKLSNPIGGVPKVEYHEQGGLLGVEVDPNFARTGLVYLSYTEAAPEQPANAKDDGDPRLGEYQDLDDVVLKGLAVARGHLDGDQLIGVQVIWRQTPKTVGRGHFGGQMAFAPDGTLFISSGDRQRFDPAQDLGSTLGKIVRINPDGSIPPDNPFVTKPGALPEIWSLGHRNQLGIAFEPMSGKLWEHEMGPKGGDEVNIIEKGKNYGWPIVSEGSHYNDVPIPHHAEKPEFQPPLKLWNPAISPSGLTFYTGDTFKELKGKALLGGLSSEALVVLTIKEDQVLDDSIVRFGKRVRDVAQMSDGDLLVLTDGDDAELLRLSPALDHKAG
ncbi:MAG TPA: PQQ-dependent sugar dehydrogenase [Mesorhizobium sp.]|nr:PQQ-dependent sugar dehydrogenase [Mesorhizobium sp.]